jgi:Transcriptional regulators
VTIRTDRVLAQLLREVHTGVTRRLAAVLQGHGCSLEEWWVLSALAAVSGRPMNEIAESAMLPSPSLTKLVDRMVQENLVYRRGDVTDRRRVMLFPTERGNARYAAIRAAVATDEAEFTAQAGSRAVADLRAALERVAGALR